MKNKIKKLIDAIFLWMGYVPKPIDYPKCTALYAEEKLDFVPLNLDFCIDYNEIRRDMKGEYEKYIIQQSISKLLDGAKPFIETKSMDVEYGFEPIRKFQLTLYVAKRKY